MAIEVLVEMRWSCSGNVPVWPKIVFVVSDEGVRIFKVAIWKILTPAADTTNTISGAIVEPWQEDCVQTGTFKLQVHCISK